jgi:hypothetical protein
MFSKGTVLIIRVRHLITIIYTHIFKEFGT